MFPRALIAAALVLLAGVLLASLGCAPAVAPEPQWEKDARALLDHVESLFVKKQYDQAARALDGFFVSYPSSRHDDRARSLAGEIQLSQRNYPQALKHYRTLIEKHPSSTLISEAKYKIGLIYFELKDYDLAIDNLEDRSKITDPAKLQRISEMLAAAYVARNRNLPAVRELSWLAANAANEKQRPGYRDRVRELVDQKLGEDDLRTLAKEKAPPADPALLRLAGLLIDQRSFDAAIDAAKDFLERFPGHPEKTRAELLIADATARKSAPRFSLGVLVPQTGPASFFGDRVLRGIRLAVIRHNADHPETAAEMLVKDTEGSPDKAAAGFSELAAAGVAAVIGPLLSREVEALVPALQKTPVPVFTPTASGAGLTELSPWLFRNALTNAAQAAAAAQYGLSRKFKKFVIFHPDDPYGKDLAKHFIREIGRNGEIVAAIAYAPETNDFGPYIRRLIEIEFRSLKIPIPEDEKERKKLFQAYSPTFDALYLPGTAEKVGLLLPQLAFYNITGKALIGSNNWHSPDLLERAGSYAEGAVFVDGFAPEDPAPAVASLVEAYRSAYQEEIDILAAQAYDATAMVLSVLKEKQDAPALREALLAVKDFPGISGLATVAPNGDVQKRLFLITVENEKFKLLTE
jgi:ABC-type branched-subunit amino acid transport system substrate-binding protein